MDNKRAAVRKTAANSKVAQSANASANAAAPQGSKKAADSKKALSPLAQCKTDVRRRIAEACMNDKENCPIIKECGQFGVGSDIWPMNLDYNALRAVITDEHQLRQGMRCINQTMGRTPEFASEFDRCSQEFGTKRASQRATGSKKGSSKAPKDVAGSKTQSKTQSKTASKTQTNAGSKTAPKSKTASKTNSGL